MIDIVLNGTGALGRMVFHLLAADDRYTVRAFTARAEYCAQKSLFGVPLVHHDDLARAYPPDDVYCLSVLGGLGGWSARQEHFEDMSTRGYRHATYVHPTAVVQAEPEWGVNNIVFPYAVIGYGGRMGSDNILREKVYLGHDFRVEDHTFAGVGATIGGGCTIGKGVYIAMEATVTNDVTLGEGAFIGIGSLLLRNADANTTYFGHPAHPAPGQVTVS